MSPPNGAARTPDVRMPDRFDEYLIQETVAGRFQMSSHAIGGEW